MHSVSAQVPVIRVFGREMPVKDAAKSIRISPWLKVKDLENNKDSIQTTESEVLLYHFNMFYDK